MTKKTDVEPTMGTPVPPDFAERLKALGRAHDRTRAEEARKRWAEEWRLAERTFWNRPNEERSWAEHDQLWDELAAKHRATAFPRSQATHAARARELEVLVAGWRRDLERAAVTGVRYARNVDPARDISEVARFIERAHSELIEKLRLAAHASGLGPYRELDERTKKRWRISLMRFVDVCAKQGWEGFPQEVTALEDLPARADSNEVELAYAFNGLPFIGIRDFEGEFFDELMSVWNDGAGTKRAGGRSKWRVLSDLVHEVWGERTDHRLLKKEWMADTKVAR